MRLHATDPALSAKQLKAIDALIQLGEVAAAASECGINKATLYRWLKEPAFVQALHAAEGRAIDDLSRMLVRLGRTATATLAKAMTDAATPMSTRVRAADVSLSRLLQLRELATLEARVTELEQSVGIGEPSR